MTYENWKLEQAEPILFEGRTNYRKFSIEKPTWLLKAETNRELIRKMGLDEMEKLIEEQTKDNETI